MLLIDGIEYNLWKPHSEEEFEKVIDEHSWDIFGLESIYFNRKHQLKSLSGIASIPDGYAIVFEEEPQWCIVEVELSNHPLHEHIVSQLSKFINGIKNFNTQKEVTNVIYNEIIKDNDLREIVESEVKSKEVYKFLLDLISQPPTLIIIIEKSTPELEEAVSALAHPYIKIVEFKTFVKAGVGPVARKENAPEHAHLFEPFYEQMKENGKAQEFRVKRNRKIKVETTSNSEIRVVIVQSGINAGLIPVLSKSRHFFPGYYEPFVIVADGLEITSYISGAPGDIQKGDPNAGSRIQGQLRPWFKNHPELRAGDEIIIHIIEPMKKYQLEIVK